MADTRKDNVIHQDVLEDAISAAWENVTALEDSGAVTLKKAWPDGEKLPKKIQIPYFTSLGRYEDKADGEDAGDAGLEMYEEEAIVQRSVKQSPITRWAQSGVGDPYEETARQIAEGANKRLDESLVEVASSLTDWKHLTVDVYNSGSPKTLDYSTFVKAQMKFKDRQKDIAAVVMSSKVLSDMYNLVDDVGRPLLTSERDGGMSKILGIPIVVSDAMTPSGFSSVVKDGTTPPDVTVKGKPNSAGLSFEIEITKGGARGTAEFRWTAGDGRWRNNVKTAAEVVLGDTGAVVEFPTGTYATDNVYMFTSGGAQTTLLLKKNSLIAWAPPPFIEVSRAPGRDMTIITSNFYRATHRYSRMPGEPRGGVVVIRHN